MRASSMHVCGKPGRVSVVMRWRRVFLPRLGCVGEDVGAGQQCFAGRVQGVALAAAMPQGFLLDALAALL